MFSLSKNFFDLFGFERKLSIDSAHLQKRFYELSWHWHPDKYSRKSATEQAVALDATALVNDGFRTLREPAKRAEYLLTEEGFPIGEQRSKDVPPELLEEVFDLNMMLEELKGGDDGARPQLEEAKSKFRSMFVAIDRQLESLFVRYDAAEPESGSAHQALQDIRGVLNRRRYIGNLIRDVDKALNPALAAAESVHDRL